MRRETKSIQYLQFHHFSIVSCSRFEVTKKIGEMTSQIGYKVHEADNGKRVYKI